MCKLCNKGEHCKVTVCILKTVKCSETVVHSLLKLVSSKMTNCGAIYTRPIRCCVAVVYKTELLHVSFSLKHLKYSQVTLLFPPHFL